MPNNGTPSLHTSGTVSIRSCYLISEIWRITDTYYSPLTNAYFVTSYSCFPAYEYELSWGAEYDLSTSSFFLGIFLVDGFYVLSTHKERCSYMSFSFCGFSSNNCWLVFPVSRIIHALLLSFKVHFHLSDLAGEWEVFILQVTLFCDTFSPSVEAVLLRKELQWEL